MKSGVQHLFLIDIDGLRWDVYEQARQAGVIPHLIDLLGPHPLQYPITSTAASITFAAQASLVTGTHPQDHGIPGNQFFDRFGEGDDQPRFFAFDMGDTLEISSAVGVFTDGLANQRLNQPTLFERLNRLGVLSVVATHMYARGATWLKPAVTHLGRFLKGGNLLGMSPNAFDQATVDNLKHHIHTHGLPPVSMIYFMGLDFESHKKSPAQQLKTLKRIDGQIGQLVPLIQERAEGKILTAVFSDHGQIETPEDVEKAIELGFPFGKELASFFSALRLDVHDYPGEAPHCDAVIALNGGTAGVYLHNKTGHWWDEPEFERDVLPIGRAFWEASRSGLYEPRLANNLDSVLIRNVQNDGWEAPYRALTPEGELIPLENWFAGHTEQPTLDPVNRLNRYTSRFTGDLLLVSNYRSGYYFGKPLRGTHGGLHPEDSQGMLTFGLGDNNPAEAEILRVIDAAIQARRTAENQRLPSVVDLVTGVEAIFNF